jgi:hypothetical protein
MLASAPEAERQAKIDLQQRINAAVLAGAGWEQIPETMRNVADTPWFQSYLAFDPGRVMRDVRQPVAVVRDSPSADLPATHADKLLELARARNRKVPSEIVDDTKALGAWLARIMG